MLRLAWIVTAAGSSRRHPPNKLLMALDGRPVICRTVAALTAFPGQVYIVLGYQAGELQRELEGSFGDQLIFVYNDNYLEGISGSVKIGVRAAGQKVDYWCFCPGDKPFISQASIEDMLAELSQFKPRILVPEYRGQPGHPTFFHVSLWQEFQTLHGDEGGRRISAVHKEKVHRLHMNDEGIVMDMDRFLELRDEKD